MLSRRQLQSLESCVCVLPNEWVIGCIQANVAYVNRIRKEIAKNKRIVLQDWAEARSWPTPDLTGHGRAVFNIIGEDNDERIAIPRSG